MGRRQLVNRRDFAFLAAAAPFGLRSALAGTLSALVTCDAEARLAVVDLDTYRVARSIATLPDPRSIELVGDRAVVCHTALGAVSIVDRRGVRHVLHGFVEPRYTAAHPDGRHAFVTDSGRSGVVAIDVLRGTELGRKYLRKEQRRVILPRQARLVPRITGKHIRTPAPAHAARGCWTSTVTWDRSASLASLCR